ncbi:16S rRNA (guanine(527)-N(7))-methyltransferase RsmG [Nocardioides ferulae]|uniref:16S rRNA (guanine(527)-N(7))-methyltransferase RsmG n=1 Tax=Nocardioides ferulae TaxID=2340821 RepID=UPI000EB2E55A|nr:16S rRNA (guanine(527)-N(7))-methyltransferase RsmG [Nocardioides ferulae]
MSGADADGGCDVSRETALPSPPAAATSLFREERLQLAQRYAEALAGPGVVRGLIGPREVGRLWERHLLNCAALGELLPENATVADVGSGAGLPGLVLAIARPDLRITLVEPLLRRTTFLEEVVDELTLPNVELVRARAEALHGERSFDVVTSRAVAPLGRLLEWSMPLVSAGGSLVAMKGSSVEGEIQDAAATLTALGCHTPIVRRCGAEVLDPPTLAVVVSWADPERVSWQAAAGRGDDGGQRGRSGRPGRERSRRRR